MSVDPKAAHLRQPGAIGDKGYLHMGMPVEFSEYNLDLHVFIVAGDYPECNHNDNQDKQDGLSSVKQNFKINRKQSNSR